MFCWFRRKRGGYPTRVFPEIYGRLQFASECFFCKECYKSLLPISYMFCCLSRNCPLLQSYLYSPSSAQHVVTPMILISGSNCRIPRHIEYLKKLAMRYVVRCTQHVVMPMILISGSNCRIPRHINYLYKLAMQYTVHGKN